MRVYFEEKWHTYKNEDRKKYISVSGLMHLIEEEKDWDRIAHFSALKQNREKGTNITGRDLQRLWKTNSKKSTDIGTLYHSIREDALLNDEEETFYNVKCKKKPCTFNSFRKVSQDIKGLENNTVYPELIIYNHELEIAGQSDKVIVVDNTIHIWDYKTDAEIKYEGYKGEKFKAPFNHLDNCNYNMYCLKMSMYMYLLHLQNPQFKVGDLVLEHIKLKRGDDNIPVLEDGKPVVLGITLYYLPYMEKEVKKICKLYKEGKL